MWCLHTATLVIGDCSKNSLQWSKMKFTNKDALNCGGAHYQIQGGLNNEECMIPPNKTSGSREVPELVLSLFFFLSRAARACGIWRFPGLGVELEL